MQTRLLTSKTVVPQCAVYSITLPLSLELGVDNANDQ